MSYTDRITPSNTTSSQTRISESEPIDWAALGLQVETVFDGTRECCPCCVAAPLGVAA